MRNREVRHRGSRIFGQRARNATHVSPFSTISLFLSSTDHWQRPMPLITPSVLAMCTQANREGADPDDANVLRSLAQTEIYNNHQAQKIAVYQ